MEKYDFLYTEPQAQLEPKKTAAPLRQAVKSMIFGLVALTMAEVPFVGFFVTPIFAIISLRMRKDYMKKYPGCAQGFLKAGKITSIISLPYCVLTTIYFIFYIVALVATEYYFC